MPPAAPYFARAIFVLRPIYRKHGQFRRLGFRYRLGKLKAAKLEVVRQQIGIDMRQTFQYYNGCRSAKIDDPFPASVPASRCK